MMNRKQSYEKILKLLKKSNIKEFQIKWKVWIDMSIFQFSFKSQKNFEVLNSQIFAKNSIKSLKRFKVS